jgi:CDP-diglyceride synthetase
MMRKVTTINSLKFMTTMAGWLGLLMTKLDELWSVMRLEKEVRWEEQSHSLLWFIFSWCCHLLNNRVKVVSNTSEKELLSHQIFYILLLFILTLRKKISIIIILFAVISSCHQRNNESAGDEQKAHR